MKKKVFLILIGLLPCLVVFGQNHIIFKEFQDPDRAYTITPFWSWNGTLKPNELKRQMDLMIDKGVYGTFMHARAGIKVSGNISEFLKKDHEMPFFAYVVDPNAPLNEQHISVRSERWRYTLFANGEEELYYHLYDPDKWANL